VRLLDRDGAPRVASVYAVDDVGDLDGGRAAECLTFNCEALTLRAITLLYEPSDSRATVGVDSNARVSQPWLNPTQVDIPRLPKHNWYQWIQCLRQYVKSTSVQLALNELATNHLAISANSNATTLYSNGTLFYSTTKTYSGNDREVFSQSKHALQILAMNFKSQDGSSDPIILCCIVEKAPSSPEVGSATVTTQNTVAMWITAVLSTLGIML
jgi:hypothetical protein